MSAEREQLLLSLIHALSGASASCVSTLLLYPLEYIKTKKLIQQKQEQDLKRLSTLEQDHKRLSTLQDSLKRIAQKSPHLQRVLQQKREEAKQKRRGQYISLCSVPKGVSQVEQISKYYNGMSSMLVGNMLSYGIYFFWYELLKRKIPKQIIKIIGTTATSSLAGIITSIFTNPFWVINTRMTETHRSFMATLQEMVQQEGVQSLFKGLQASLMLVINPIIQFVIYERLKGKQRDGGASFVISFLNGAISKAVATILTFPYIVIRTYLQTNKTKGLTTVQVAQQVMGSHGIKGFFTGMEYKLWQTVLNAALMLSLYEKVFQQVQHHLGKS